MLKQKLLKCDVCGKEVPIRSRVKNKESEYYGKMACNMHARKINKTYLKQTKKNKGYSKFFKKHCELIKAKNERCVNCGKKLIGSPSEVAHILAKSKYPELATNDDNVIYLCMDCHVVFDSCYSSREKMNCFKNAVVQFEKIKNKVERIDKEYQTYGKTLS